MSQNETLRDYINYNLSTDQIEQYGNLIDNEVVKILQQYPQRYNLPLADMVVAVITEILPTIEQHIKIAPVTFAERGANSWSCFKYERWFNVENAEFKFEPESLLTLQQCIISVIERDREIIKRVFNKDIVTYVPCVILAPKVVISPVTIKEVVAIRSVYAYKDADGAFIRLE